MNYAIEAFDGHVLVALPEGRFLIDTGSPLSFARTRRATFGGTETNGRSSGVPLRSCG